MLLGSSLNTSPANGVTGEKRCVTTLMTAKETQMVQGYRWLTKYLLVSKPNLSDTSARLCCNVFKSFNTDFMRMFPSDIVQLFAGMLFPLSSWMPETELIFYLVRGNQNAFVCGLRLCVVESHFFVLVLLSFSFKRYPWNRKSGYICLFVFYNATVLDPSFKQQFPVVSSLIKVPGKLLTLVLSRLICSSKEYPYPSPTVSKTVRLTIQFLVITHWQLYYIFSSKFTNRWSADPATGLLTLSSLQLEDFGLFQCVVTNKVSEHYVVSLLVVTGMSHHSVHVTQQRCSLVTFESSARFHESIHLSDQSK